MSNKWVQHVQQYAKENNITYSCALSHPDIKKGYEPVIKKTSKEKKAELTIQNDKIIIKDMIKRIKNSTEEERPVILMKFNSLKPELKEEIKMNYPNIYNKLNIKQKITA